MRFLYSIAIRCYSGLISLASVFGNKKAQLWSEGRVGQWDKLRSDNDDEWIWFHVSSLGEFEQGLPLMESIKKEFAL